MHEVRSAWCVYGWIRCGLVRAMQVWSMVWLFILFVEEQLACLLVVLWIRRM
jgi:hypothetical protein